MEEWPSQLAVSGGSIGSDKEIVDPLSKVGKLNVFTAKLVTYEKKQHHTTMSLINIVNDKFQNQYCIFYVTVVLANYIVFVL